MNLKETKTALLLSMAILSATAFSYVQAGTCGMGVITELKEGGWNTDDLMIKIDYRVTASAHNGTEWQGFVRFKANELSVERMKSIRAMAYLALATSPRLVWIGTHNSDCSRATEISLFDDIY